MSRRTELAAAAGTLAGLKPHPYVTSDTEPGTVFIRLDRIEYPDRFGGIEHWNVVVLLPEIRADAERYVEDVIPALTTVINRVIKVTSVVPQRIQLDGVGILPCVFLNGHREAD